MSEADHTYLHPLSKEELPAQKQQILHALDLLKRREAFARAPRMVLLLEYLVNETLAGRGHRLQQYQIALEVFERDEGFNQQEDPIVRVQVGRLRKLLNSLADELAAEAELWIEIPKGTYQPTFLRSKALPGSARGGQESAVSLAILPFQVTSDDPGHQRLGSRLAGGLSSLCAQAPIIPIHAFHHAEQASRQQPDIPSVLAQLPAGFALVGTVDIEGTEAELRVELLRCNTLDSVWSMSIETEAGKQSLRKTLQQACYRVFLALTDASGVLQSLATVELQNRKIDQLTASEAILLSFNFLNAPSPETFPEAHRLLTHATQVAPSDPRAWAYLAHIEMDNELFGYRPTFKSRELSLKHLEKALGLDPANADANYVACYIYTTERQQERVISYASRLQALAPSPSFFSAAAAFFLGLCRSYQKGKAAVDAYKAHYPAYPRWFNLLDFMLALQVDDGEAMLAAAREFDTPGLLWTDILYANSWLRLGEAENAQAAVRRIRQSHPVFIDNPKHYMGKLVLSREDLDKLMAPFPGGDQPTRLSAV